MEDRLRVLEERILRLEASPFRSEDQPQWVLWVALGLLIASVGLGYYGFGAPNHVYQFGAAVLFVGLCYHCRWLSWKTDPLSFCLAFLNLATSTFLMKVVLGTGLRSPFYWAQYPTLEKAKQSGQWIKGLMNYDLTWQASELAKWQVDVSVVQGLLLILSLFGVLFRFQPFASLVAFALVVVSIPSLVEFNWDYAFPALVAGMIGIYLQVRAEARFNS